MNPAQEIVNSAWVIRFPRRVHSPRVMVDFTIKYSSGKYSFFAYSSITVCWPESNIVLK